MLKHTKARHNRSRPLRWARQGPGAVLSLMVTLLLALSLVPAGWARPPRPDAPGERFLRAATRQQEIDFGRPVRIAVLPSGQLLATYHNTDAVVHWDPARNRVIRVIHTGGQPTAVGWARGRIYVGNETSGAVEVYTPSGRLRGVLGGEAGQIARPSDLALDAEQGLLFVTDTNLGRVLVYDLDGPLLRTLPAEGEARLNFPTGIAVDPGRREVLVSDFDGDATRYGLQGWVRIYDYAGKELSGIRGSGVAAGKYGFSRPQGLAVSAQGRIYLVDSYRGQVLVFDRASLSGIAMLGAVGSHPDQSRLWLPLDVAIDPGSQNVYVTNNLRRRIEQFDGKGWLP